MIQFTDLLEFQMEIYLELLNIPIFSALGGLNSWV